MTDKKETTFRTISIAIVAYGASILQVPTQEIRAAVIILIGLGVYAASHAEKK